MKSNVQSSLTAEDIETIVQNVLRAIKEQQDRKQAFVSRKTISINPQVLIKQNPSVFGPYYFETAFKKGPSVTFGEARSAQSGIKGILIVKCYVDSWITSAGGINGINIGVYAHTPVPRGLNNHTIMYEVNGKASLYKADSRPDAWSQGYNSNKASHLYTDPGDLASGT